MAKVIVLQMEYNRSFITEVTQEAHPLRAIVYVYNVEL
jgi:hypothetical protein